MRTLSITALVDRLWTIQEREKLLDAVSKVAIDDYASIADIIGNTRSPAEVRDYLKRIQARSDRLEGSMRTYPLSRASTIDADFPEGFR